AAYLARSRFRKRFEAKGRFESYLAAIATGVIVAPHPALDGAARHLAQNIPGSRD
ncbi:MAG: glucokinase, partial [Methylibium sp.]|nr:glucokinase [Methylibium sp.]